MHISHEIGDKFIKATYMHIGEPVPDAHQGIQYVEPPGSPKNTNGKRIGLPDPCITDMGLTECIGNRRSHRHYSDGPMADTILSYLLWATQGLHKEGRNWSLRSVPSAGARHPLDTYVLVNNVSGLSKGLYWYDHGSNELMEVDLSGGISHRLSEACLGQDFVSKANVSFFWVAVPYRSGWCYGERSYRYIGLDAGHICQNLYLAAEAMGCGCCSVAAFYDTKLNDALGINGKDRFAIYAAAVGLRA